MHKKGFLLGEHTLKLIIAIVCILFLLYLLFALYSIFAENKGKDKAEATLKNIINVEMTLARTNNDKKTEFPVMEPKEWNILNYNDRGDINPECSKNCLCICPDTYYLEWDSLEERCQKDGACKKVDYKVNGAESGIEIKEEGIQLVLTYNEKESSFKIETK